MADLEATYRQDQIKEFYKAIPSRHDDTKFLGGEPDSYYVGAAKSGDNWFVGGINAVRVNTAKVDFSFLDADKSYTAEIFYNDPTDYKQVKRTVKTITAKSKENIEMVKYGGFAIRLIPKA